MNPSKMNTIRLISETGFSVEILPFGGIITKMLALNTANERENVVLAYDDLNDYLDNRLFLGCAVGPVAGRTRNGKIPLNEGWLQLDVKHHPNSLHSGVSGFHQVLFDIAEATDDTLTLTHKAHITHMTESSVTEPSNMETIPLIVTLIYKVLGESLTIETRVTSEKQAYVSMTNHSYFNLSGCCYGHPKRTLENHQLKLDCSHYAKLDEASLPIQLTPLKQSCFDFTETNRLGDIFGSNAADVQQVSGIDHPFKCSETDESAPDACTQNTRQIAWLHEPTSGRIMTVSTTQPYAVIYSGNFLDAHKSPSGVQFTKHAGICFETQDLPDVANNKLDKVVYVTPESPYVHQTTFSFSCQSQS